MAEALSEDGEGDDEEEQSAPEDDDISIKIGKKPENIDELKERQMLAEEKYQQAVDEQNTKYHGMSAGHRRQQILKDARYGNRNPGRLGEGSSISPGRGGQQPKHSFPVKGHG